ncbi:YndM family protein [Bacillus carboniphilus]|uniref:YndM family protein n=1 Tax=Bacillus carboniphilus TaxID=86663 RepID=A0ABN0VQP3_9BACI
MRHLVAFIIKLAANGIVIFSFLAIYNPNINIVLTIAILTTVLAYIIGDLGILRRLGNTAATIGDFLLAFITIGGLSYFMIQQSWNMIITSFFAAVAITVIEILYHLFVKHYLFEENKETRVVLRTDPKQRFATEFSKELYVRSRNKKK